VPIPTAETQVIVAGAGPVGLTLAIDLGRRGVEVLLLERDRTTKPFPKMDRSNARTMELYRRIGIVDAVRARGYPPEVPMDVFIVNRLCDPPLAVLEYPSVAEYRDLIDATDDGTLPLEPYQLVSQNDLEPLLAEIASGTPGVTVAFGRELVSFTQDGGGVTVQARRTGDAADGWGGAGTITEVRADYLVGTDGGSSTVRKQLGIELSGRADISRQTQVIFGSDDLFDRIPIGKGRHYNFTDPEVRTLVVQGSRREFTAHTSLDRDDDLEAAIRRVVGFDFDMEIRHVIPWRQHLLVADRFRDGRVFLAGDAIHLVIPTGGLGMNSGVGDAFDLSWKLAGTLEGWGGPGLLDSYEAERRPVALRNVEASGWAAAGVPVWKALIGPAIADDTPAGEALRAEVGASAEVNHGRMHGMVGVEMGYTYAGSDLVAVEQGNEAEWEISSYTPHTRPGVRIPHVWLADGVPIQDRLGDGYNLVDLAGHADVEPVRAAFERAGAPVSVLRSDESRARQVYGCSVLVLRPDLHVAWRGDAAPRTDEVDQLVAMATGHGPPVRSGLDGDRDPAGPTFVGFGPRRAFRSS
jgi:2-polyprenyl-6-methoxyphenol hydroxylase-like FAD-dependent oxidoreductase